MPMCFLVVKCKYMHMYIASFSLNTDVSVSTVIWTILFHSFKSIPYFLSTSAQRTAWVRSEHQTCPSLPCGLRPAMRALRTPRPSKPSPSLKVPAIVVIPSSCTSWRSIWQIHGILIRLVWECLIFSYFSYISWFSCPLCLFLCCKLLNVFTK